MRRILAVGFALTTSGVAFAAPPFAGRDAHAYVARIARLNHSGPRLNAVIVVNPDWRKQAAALDAEARAGKVRGPLHGRAILIKDNINALFEVNRARSTKGTRPAVFTTASTEVFADASNGPILIAPFGRLTKR